MRNSSVIRILYAASNQILFKFLFISLFGLVRLYYFRFFFGPIIVRRSLYVFSSRKKSKNLNFEKARFRLEERKFKTRLRDFVFGSQRENSEFKTRLPVKSKLLLLYENLWSYNIFGIISNCHWMVTFDQNGIKSN